MKNSHLVSSFFVVLFMASNIFGQSQKSLSKQLWDRAQSCYVNFEDTNDDGKLDDIKIIDDSKNGYLKILGTVGTCGCTCSKTIAAFKGNNENYTFLEQETLDCSWLHKVSSNRNLVDILPENFGIQSFIPNFKDTLSKKALFYLDFNIPQYGTNTRVTLKIIPFGMNIESDSLLVYKFSEDDSHAHLQESQSIHHIIATLSSESLNDILNGKKDNLSKKDTNLIIAMLKKDDQKLTIEMFVNQLRELKKIYDLYISIQYKSILLKWDKEKVKFYIEKKGEAVTPIRFKDFLKNEKILKYWIAIC